MLNPTDRIGEYVVDDVVGHGGYATVYRAHHRSGARYGASHVALKVLDERDRHPPQLDRLEREFNFASRVEHDHIVRMYESGIGWLAMELVTAGTVSRLTTLSNKLAALADIAGALDYIHRRGIVHCDVKPSNILISQQVSRPGAILIDFGIAYAVAEAVGHRPSHIEVSLPYAAPEVLNGHAPSAATDEYALACTAVELLTGAPPFVADTALELIDAHLSKPAPRYSYRIDWIPHAFNSILAKAMAKDPDARYQSCAEFVALVTRSLS